MNLETFFVGCVMLTISVVGFFYVLKLQDKWIEKMKERFDNDTDGSLRM